MSINAKAGIITAISMLGIVTLFVLAELNSAILGAVIIAVCLYLIAICIFELSRIYLGVDKPEFDESNKNIKESKE